MEEDSDRMAGQRRSRSKGGKRKSVFGRVVAWLLILVLVCGSGAAAYVWFVPFGSTQEKFVEIVPGSPVIEISRQLEQAGVIPSRYAFDALRILEPGVLKAGTYRFAGPDTVKNVYDRIHRGDIYTIAVTIPEGSTVFDIAARLQGAKLGPAAAFLAAAKSEKELIKDLDPQATSLEGYLFPDTYRFAPNVKPVEIAAVMVKRFRTAAEQLGLREDVHNVVTKASLIERETAVDSERPLVASVFENRLDKNMPLMTDPSVIYGLELQGLWRGAIYTSDLKHDTPYNTYIHAGLPPGPVANPGIKSLRAAMKPAQTDYLYFVAAGANPQGKSLFAATLEEHNRNVSGYRDAMKKAGGR
jgi:UPF0755 protein